MSEAADFVVIGSGPAGVSAALPLIEAGRRVIMVDGGDDQDNHPGSSWERMLGPQLESLRPDEGLSPKLCTPEARRELLHHRRLLLSHPPGPHRRRARANARRSSPPARRFARWRDPQNERPSHPPQ